MSELPQLTHDPEVDVTLRRVRSVELLISRLLRIGVRTSLTVVVVGIVVMFAHHPEYLNSRAAFVNLTGPAAEFPHTFSTIARDLGHVQGRALIALGLALLVLTPIMRVAVSVVIYLVQRDWVFVVITVLVLTLLAGSFWLGRMTD